jgi:hypothetical protein
VNLNGVVSSSEVCVVFASWSYDVCVVTMMMVVVVVVTDTEMSIGFHGWL